MTDNAFDLVHDLMSDMESEAPELGALESALDEVDRPDAAHHFQNADNHFKAARNYLDLGDDSLLADTIEHHGDGTGEFTNHEQALEYLEQIQYHLNHAFSELDETVSALTDEDTIPADSLDTNLGVYETLTSHAKFVRASVEHMRDTARNAHKDLESES